MFEQKNKKRKRFRPRKLKLHPAKIMLESAADEIMFLREMFGMTVEKAMEHRKLYGLGNIFVTENASEDSEYQVVVRIDTEVPQQLAAGVPITMIAVKRLNNSKKPIPWQDMQNIKNILVGAETEAVELYPKESRSNRVDGRFRYMWAFMGGTELPVGYKSTERT